MEDTITKIYGGKWWKPDFHVHTPASEDYGKGSENPEDEKNITPKEFLLNAMSKKLDCLIISDHNTFKWIPQLGIALKEMEENNEIGYRKIYIFPAVELNVNGNIHVLGIFDIGTDYETLAGILGKVEYSDSCKATTKSLAEVIEIIVKNGGIAIPAHVDGPSGMFYEELCSASTIKSALEVDGILALEMTGLEVCHQLYIENKKKLSYVLGSDSHCLESLGKNYTWVKMGTPNIEALRLALFDEEDGVRRSKYIEGNPNDINERMYIKYIEIKEAKYAGRRKPLRIEFSPWMTSIIGGRGTGKSSIIQFLRVVLKKHNDLPDELKKEFEEFVAVPKTRNDLGMFRDETIIDICIVKEGMEYFLRWYNGKIYEKFSGTEEEAIDVEKRFPVRIFNQKQLFEMTKNANLLLQYVDSQWKSYEWKKVVDSKKVEYKECMILYRKICERKKEQNSIMVSLREIESKIKAFETETTKKILEEQKNILIEEQQIKDLYMMYASLISKYIEVQQSIDDISSKSIVLDKIDDKSAEVINKWQNALKDLNGNVKSLLSQYKDSLITYEELFDKLECAKLKLQNKTAMENVIEELKEHGIEGIDLYPILLQNRDKLVEQLKEYKDVDKALIENRNRQSDILLEYSDLMKKRISERKRVIDIWNCNSGLRVSLITFGNLEDNEKAFRNMIMKTGSTFSNDILKMDGDDVYCGGIIYDIANPKDNNKIVDELRNKFDKIVNVDSSIMGKSIEKHLKSIFENKPEICDEIMTWIPDDKVVLELKMSNNRYVKIDAGSAGQRTSAILALLLQISDTPLIIDQPEDDLDTKNISEFVVKGINNKKRNQQIIVVTHNPNIVVNTNSEQIIHMEYGGGEINASHSGALQELEIRDAICDVMEGGREALDARYYRISKALLK